MRADLRGDLKCNANITKRIKEKSQMNEAKTLHV